MSATIHEASPRVTAFYTPHADASSTPGALLRVQPFTTAVLANAPAWLIRYTTTRDDGVPVVASAEVMAVSNQPSTTRPVIAWSHGAIGYVQMRANAAHRP